jgi:peptidyl-prolyl cis-trans isomerase NIMA-interacting 1
MPLFIRGRRAVVIGSGLIAIAIGVGCGASPQGADGSSVASASSAALDANESACLDRANATRGKKPGEPEQITVSHILVKHRDAENPEGGERSRGEACRRAEAARDKMRAGGDWDAVVAEFSDEKGAKTRSGSVGEVTRAMVVPPFADAAFELDAQELSDVVESKFGFHVILRTQ